MFVSVLSNINHEGVSINIVFPCKNKSVIVLRIPTDEMKLNTPRTCGLNHRKQEENACGHSSRLFLAKHEFILSFNIVCINNVRRLIFNNINH